MLGFTAVTVLAALAGLVYVVAEAKVSQRTRTASENQAHARELLLHLVEIADKPERIRAAAQAIEDARAEMFRELDYHSHVRMRIWQHGQLLYNSLPALPDKLPLIGNLGNLGDSGEHEGYAWAQSIQQDAATGIKVERSHEVDDGWMLSFSGITFLLKSNVLSLPLLLLPAWLIVGIGLRPLRSFAQAIEQRSAQDLTPLPASGYRELTPLVDAINALMARLRHRIEHEHQFITDAAHELKTPLAAIQLNAHLLQARSAESDPQRHAEVSQGLRTSVARANHVVHQLLAFERANTEPDAQPLPELSLEVLVRDCLATAAPLALQRNVEIDFQAGDPCERALHQESLCALVDNLVGNAIKYSPDHGRVTVQLEAQGSGCRLSVLDQGPGIPASLRQRVFERFYRLPGQAQTGSGLGLAIAERAAQRNAAQIRLGDGPAGVGLLVTVEFAGALA
jgi:two-component system sensor histidine kinase QseC